VIGFFMGHPYQPLAKEDVLKCMESTLPSKSQKPGANQTKCLNWIIPTGVRYAWSVGLDCTRRKAQL